MSKFAVLIQPWSISVKSWYFFVDQGGTKLPWGKEWKLIEAHDMEAARRKGRRARDSRPGPCHGVWPSRRRLKDHGIEWMGNAGVCLNCGSGFMYEERAIKKALKKMLPRHNFKRSAASNAKAFASTKSKDGQYPI